MFPQPVRPLPLTPALRQLTHGAGFPEAGGLGQKGSQQESHTLAAQGLPSSLIWPEPLKAEASSLSCLREIGLSFVQRKGLSLTRPI